MRSLRSLALVFGVCLASGSLGCVIESAPPNNPNNGPPDGKAWLRIVHASSDAPTVDIWAGGEPLVEGLKYGDASEWLVLDPASYDVEIKASPSKAEDPAVYKTGPFAVEEGDKVSAIAAGLIGSMADASKFRVLSVREEFSPAGSGSAIARVVHAAADAPTVGIDLHNDDPAAPEISKIDRFTDTAAAGFVLSSGQKLQIGVASNGARVTAFTTPELPEGAELLIVATGLVASKPGDANGFSLLAIGPDGSLGFIRQNPFVYALHAGPDAPPVDLYAEKTLLTSLSFGQLGGPVQIPPGDYTIDFRAMGTDPTAAPAASAKATGLEPGQEYLSIATGFLGSTGSDGFQLLSFANGFPREAADPLIRVVHGAPDAPTVDIGILNAEKVVNPVLVKAVSFGQAADPGGMNMGTGTIPVGVTPAGMNDQVVASFHVPTTPTLKAFAVAAGSLTGKGETFRLLAVDTSTSPWTAATIHPQPQP
jgi:hypothetical protein